MASTTILPTPTAMETLSVITSTRLGAPSGIGSILAAFGTISSGFGMAAIGLGIKSVGLGRLGRFGTAASTLTLNNGFEDLAGMKGKLENFRTFQNSQKYFKIPKN